MKVIFTTLALLITTSLSAQVCPNCGRNLQQTTQQVRFEITLNPGEELISINGVPVTTQSLTTSPQRNTGRQALGSDVAAAWGNPNLIQQALASARYRASRGISGHCSHDTSHRGFRRSGVGWSTNNRTPRTCFWEHRNNPNAAYVSVRGRRGYYATLLIR